MILFTSYNIGDILGKYLGGLNILIKKSVGVRVVLSRFIFFFFFLVIATNRGVPFFENDNLAILISFLFAVTNGLSTALFFVLGS